MESIFTTLTEEVNTITVSKFLIDTEEVFSNGASKLGLSNLKAIKELCVKEGEHPRIIDALDSFIKSIKNKKFEDSNSASKAVEEIMKILYPISESDEDSSSDEEDISSDEESEDEIEEETDNEEIEEDERYNELLKDKVLKKYIVTKRFKITTTEEKIDMIESLYKIVKNIYENFASDRDADKILDILEELDELRDC